MKRILKIFSVFLRGESLTSVRFDSLSLNYLSFYVIESLFFADVITKFSEKLKEIESEVGEVLKLEAHEKEILKSENQISKGERLMKGDRAEKRVWFQTKAERDALRGKKIAIKAMFF